MFDKPRMSVSDYITKKLLGRGKHEDGSEAPDPVPMAPPLGYVEQPNLWEQMREMIRREMSLAAEAEGKETFEEADDFDVEDDPFPMSDYEVPDDLGPAPVVDRGSPPGKGGEGAGSKPEASPPEPQKAAEPAKPQSAG